MKNLLVKCNIEVYKENEYYFNGTNYFSIVCGDVSRELKVIDYRMAIPDAVAQYEPNRKLISQYFNTRVEQPKCFSISDKFANEFKETATYNGVMPSTINVWRVSKNRIDYSVNFKQYCRIVMVCEEGYEDRQTDYKKAFALAIKHFGWFMKLKPRSDTAADISDDSEKDQRYSPETRSLSDYPKCDQAMHDT